MPTSRLARSPADLEPGAHVTTLLFDWDGTLFDNHEFNFRALQQALAQVDIDITEAWFHESSGFSASGIVELAKQRSGSQASTTEILAARDRWAAERLADVAPIAPVLALLTSSAGRKVGVVTGSNRSNIEGLLWLHELDAHIDVLVTRDQLTRGKPSPEGYRTAMEALRSSPDEVLVYEDSDQGIEAALAAGADVIDVRGLAADVER